jgi:Ca2+ transporting ATPase
MTELMLLFDLRCDGVDQPAAVLRLGQVLKNIAGQSFFQLLVMYALVFHGDSIFSIPSAVATEGPSIHYTLVFNTFVLMQLFNQVCSFGAHYCKALWKAQVALPPWMDAMPCALCSRKRNAMAVLQVNSRKIYDEADVLGGILENRLFLGILAAETVLQVGLQLCLSCDRGSYSAGLAHGMLILQRHYDACSGPNRK